MELNSWEDGDGFATSVPGAGPGWAASPLPMVMNNRRPTSSTPDGPVGSPL
jgi:hypothetical protein